MIEEIKAIGTNFTKYYDLIIELVLRDIKVKYKRSILGFAWSILNPLLMMKPSWWSLSVGMRTPDNTI